MRRNPLNSASLQLAVLDRRLERGRNNDMVEMQVEDNGPGFSEQLPVFDAFFTTKKQGTGLGLAIAHRIVSDHGGTIRVET